MEPVTIVTTIMGVLMPYVTRSAKALASAAGEVAADKAKGLLDTLKQKFAGNQTDADNLKRFEEKPEVYRGVIEDTLNKKVTEDPKLADELSKIIEEGSFISVAQKWREAKTVTGVEIGDVARANININQDGDKVEDLLGLKAGNIGTPNRRSGS